MTHRRCADPLKPPGYYFDVELTDSWTRVIPLHIQKRYEFIETRNAAAVLASTNASQFQDVCDSLDAFCLTIEDIMTPGGNETAIAARLNQTFRDRGWQEERAVTTIRNYMQERGRTRLSEDGKIRAETVSENKGYYIDNVKGRVVLDVEWNAKDGNLDRDLAMYRWLYDVGFVEVAVMITREHVQLRDLGQAMRRSAGQTEKEIGGWLGTSTTTNLQKLLPRVQSGGPGGCPFLAIAVTTRTRCGVNG